MKDHHVLVTITGGTRGKFNALKLVEAALIGMGADKPYKIWGNANEAQGVLTAKDQSASE
jgi:hypothetical protein